MQLCSCFPPPSPCGLECGARSGCCMPVLRGCAVGCVGACLAALHFLLAVPVPACANCSSRFPACPLPGRPVPTGVLHTGAITQTTPSHSCARSFPASTLQRSKPGVRGAAASGSDSAASKPCGVPRVESPHQVGGEQQLAADAHRLMLVCAWHRLLCFFICSMTCTTHATQARRSEN